MKCVIYTYLLIFIIIKCVKSQDNDPDQPADEEDEDDNFEVLDLEQIIQQRLSRFEDPQYQPQYQQLEESQYPTQPQAQPQHYPGYQPESLHYQPETFQYQFYGPPQTATQQPESLQYQPELLEYDPYKQYQVQTQEQLEEPQYPTQPQIQPQQYDYYQPESQGYHPETQEYQTQPEQYDFYQPETLHYQPEAYGYYEPPTTQHSQQPQQYYGPPLTQASQQPSYPYYLPPPTQPSYQQQPQYQYYQPTTAQTPTQTEVIQSQPQTQSETVEDDDDFYVTEHDQPQQIPSATETGHETTQKSIQPQKEPRKRTRTRSTSGDKDDDEEEEKSKKGRKPKSYRKSKKLKFIKKNSDGNLVEMTEEDYDVIHSDSTRTKYVFNANLEQLHCGSEIIYEHTSRKPYCSLLIHSKKTDIFILVNNDRFTLIRKVKGSWTKNLKKTPNYVKLYTQDEEGNKVLITNKDYNIDFTPFGSFRYELNPGVKCHKIKVKDMIAWEKTEDDEGFPELIYVSPKFTVIVKFNKYTKTFEKRTRKYQLLYTKKNTKKGKYY